MAHRFQEDLQKELNDRIPKGPRGSRQRELRMRWWFFRSQRYSFDESIAKAVEGIRQTDPSFLPQILPPPTPAEAAVSR